MISYSSFGVLLKPRCIQCAVLSAAREGRKEEEEEEGEEWRSRGREGEASLILYKINCQPGFVLRDKTFHFSLLFSQDGVIRMSNSKYNAVRYHCLRALYCNLYIHRFIRGLSLHGARASVKLYIYI